MTTVDRNVAPLRPDDVIDLEGILELWWAAKGVSLREVADRVGRELDEDLRAATQAELRAIFGDR